MLFNISMFPIGSGDNLSRSVVDEHNKCTSRLHGAVEDVDRELGRIVAR